MKCLVYSHLKNKNLYGFRVSNLTIKVPKEKLFDSDSEFLTDKYGHRYKRCFSLEEFCPGYFLFTQI